MKLKNITSTIERKLLREAIILSVLFVTTFTAVISYKSLNQINTIANFESTIAVQSNINANSGVALQSRPDGAGKAQSNKNLEHSKSPLIVSQEEITEVDNASKNSNDEPVENNLAGINSSKNSVSSFPIENSGTQASAPYKSESNVDSRSSSKGYGSGASLSQSVQSSSPELLMPTRQARAIALENQRIPNSTIADSNPSNSSVALQSDTGTASAAVVNDANQLTSSNSTNRPPPTLNRLEPRTFYDDPVVCPPLTNFPEDWREGAVALQRQAGCIL